jgi:hypothetical protein
MLHASPDICAEDPFANSRHRFTITFIRGVISEVQFILLEQCAGFLLCHANEYDCSTKTSSQQRPLVRCIDRWTSSDALLEAPLEPSIRYSFN